MAVQKMVHAKNAANSIKQIQASKPRRPNFFHCFKNTLEAVYLVFNTRLTLETHLSIYWTHIEQKLSLSCSATDDSSAGEQQPLKAYHD